MMNAIKRNVVPTFSKPMTPEQRIEKHIEAARQARAEAEAAAELEALNKRTRLKEEIATRARRRVEFENATAEWQGATDQVEKCKDNDERIELERRCEILFNRRERARRNLPTALDGIGDTDRLIQLASRSAKARLDLARSHYLFWQSRVSTLENPSMEATDEEIKEARQQLEKAGDEYERCRQRCIDE